jgi:TRAP-type C4-dicarboxylate transport system permease small subunit
LDGQLPTLDDERRAILARRFRVERHLGAAVMLALCLITLANVLVRYFTDISFAFTEEISVALMVVMTFVASAKAFLDGNQIAVTWFVQFFARRMRRRLALFSLAASIVMFAIIVWYGGRMAWDDYRYEVTSPGIGAPQWLYTVWLPLLALVVILRLLQGVRDVLRGRLDEESP